MLGKAYLIVLYLTLVSTSFTTAQIDSTMVPVYEYDDTINLGFGYSYSFAEPHFTGFHLVEIGLNRSRFGGMHASGFQYGVSTEIGLNTENLVIGPKVGGVIYYQFFVLSTDLLVYTDFEQWSMRFVPGFGIGIDRFRITMNPQVILIHKDYEPVNRGVVNLSINIALTKGN